MKDLSRGFGLSDWKDGVAESLHPGTPLPRCKKPGLAEVSASRRGDGWKILMS